MSSEYRMTPQTTTVLHIIRKLGHGTNLEILNETQEVMPDITATTVHRITKRLVSRGLLSCGPQINGVQLIDANNSIHDHFLCNDCGGVKDFKISSQLRNKLKKEAGIHITADSLTIFGNCDGCLKIN